MAVIAKDEGPVSVVLGVGRDWGTVVVRLECVGCKAAREGRYPAGWVVDDVDECCGRCGEVMWPVDRVEDGTMSVPGGVEVAG